MIAKKRLMLFVSAVFLKINENERLCLDKQSILCYNI